MNMHLLYNLLALVLVILAAPVFLYRLIREAGFGERLKQSFGWLPAETVAKVANKNAIWLHAASVGEIVATSPMVKEIKKEILGYIKNLVMVGRSLGIFIFTSLQKPSQSSIPSDIKSQLTTRISFKQLDSSTSVLILGNGNATSLEKREAIVRTIQEDKIKVPYIDHEIIMQNIKDSIELQHKYIELKKDIVGPPQNEVEFNTNGLIDLSKYVNL